MNLPGGAAFQNAQRHFQHVAIHFAGTASGSPIADGVGRVSHAQAAEISVYVGVGGVNLADLALLVGHADHAAVFVGVAQVQRAVCAVEFEGLIGPYALGGEQQMPQRTVLVQNGAYRVVVRLHQHFLPEQGAVGVQVSTVRVANLRKAADGLRRAQQESQRRQVVRAHIEDHAAVRPEGEALVIAGIGPFMMIGAAQCDLRCHRRANDAAVQQLPGQLHPACQKGVRRTAHEQPLGGRQFHQFRGLLHGKGSHFFTVDVLARLQRGLGALEVSRWIGGIHHHFNGGIRKDLLIGHAANAKFLCSGFAALGADVRAGRQFQNVELFLHVFEIDSADHAAADQRRFHFLQLLHTQHLLCFLVRSL